MLGTESQVAKCKYPDCVLTVSDVAYIIKQRKIKIDKREMVHHSALDIPKAREIDLRIRFLISYTTAAERVTAEEAR